MFSFHKPRVYRSAEGCCICRAKSSSSRFTDSRKYEHDSMKCFDLKYPRHGEICNACVLLVKRFKRLPVGSTRHWGHVVDARAGPGTKSITKHKKSRDDGAENSPGASNSNNSGTTSRRTQNSKSIITEKFSKIFKKSKNKITGNVNNSGGTPKKEAVGKRRSSGSTAQSWKEQQQPSLPTTPDSIDSDYEDSGGRTCLASNGSVVQFQTQTRASSYRSRNRNGNISCAEGTLTRRRIPIKTGSKRRKCLPPVRNRRTLDKYNDNVQFFDESEWKERKSCCGMVYECEALTGTFLIDLKYFKPCSNHLQHRLQNELIAPPPQSADEPVSMTQNIIIATLPAVVQLTPPSAPNLASVTAAPTLPIPVSVTTQHTNPTPVLKKHHLFFKRQSECFPHGDLNINSSVNNNNNMNTLTKTESFATIAVSSNKSNNSTSLAAPIDNTATNNVNCSNNMTLSTQLPLPINMGSNMTSITGIHSTTIVGTQMPRHSTAKVTTISPPTNNSGNKLLHKIKTGKIFKHSLATGAVVSTGVAAAATAAAAADRINKTADGHDLKNIVRTVPKSFVLTKPAINNNPAYTQLTSSTLHYPVGSSPTSTCSNSSTISSSSSAAPKFSDNSSDSGFDENMQERKSASPLQEDTEKKLATRAPVGNVQTMFLASGVQIQGQQQNLMLTGNEVAAKLLQNRKQQMPIVTIGNSNIGNNNIQQHYQQQSNNGTRLNNSTSALKIAQVVGTGSASTSATTTVTIGATSNIMGGSHAKSVTRTMYNNNTIQHENGVTTIVPASSLAASTQTAAMNALAPSTVTITPAPTHHLTAAASLAKKLTSSSTTLIATTNNGNGNNQSNILHTVNNGVTHLSTISGHNNNLLQQQQSHHSVSNGLNQKIILVKTSSTTKYNSNLNGSGNKTATINATSAIGVPTAISANGSTGVCKN